MRHQAGRPTIARIWRGRTRREVADEYEAYNYDVGITPLIEKAMGVQTLREDRTEDTEFITLSYWESVDAMSRFTGGNPTRVHHLDRDHEFLIEPPRSVQILRILAAHGNTGGDGPATHDAADSTQSESEVRALFERRAEAMRMKDIDRLMPLYAPDVVYFDLVPPLRYSGTAALRARFLDWFGRWTSDIGQDIHDVNISASGDVAAAFMLVRASGTLKTGQEVGYWVRVSNSCRHSDGTWLITHEHVSLPVDLKSRSAVTDLIP